MCWMDGWVDGWVDGSMDGATCCEIVAAVERVLSCSLALPLPLPRPSHLPGPPPSTTYGGNAESSSPGFVHVVPPPLTTPLITPSSSHCPHLYHLQPEVAMSCSPGFVHVPFLRSGMFAAHQGYSLQSDLSRVRLQSRLADPKHGISARVVASATGLNVVMEASRRARTPNSPFHLPHLPGLTVAMATPAELAECLGAPARPPVRTDAYLNEEEDEELMAARELLSWEAAQEERKAVAAAVRASKAPWPPAEVDSHLAAEVQPLLSARKLRFKRPAAPKEDVLEALAALPGVNRDVMVSSAAEVPVLGRAGSRRGWWEEAAGLAH